MYKPPQLGPQTQPPGQPQLLPNFGSPPVTPMAGPGVKIMDDLGPQYSPGASLIGQANQAGPLTYDNPEPSTRQRLAEAILKATSQPEGQTVQHPMQALGNASSQMAQAYLQKQQQPQGPARTSPLPGPGPVRPPVNDPTRPMPKGPMRPRPTMPLRQMGAGVRPGGMAQKRPPVP